ncbi:MAG: hypothetical protein OXB96_03065 [Candidatus Kaiserbacteria bacterium]|nr:hypothetical protein [Candidatus Kaiserbacteria bacterium]
MDIEKIKKSRDKKWDKEDKWLSSGNSTKFFEVTGDDKTDKKHRHPGVRGDVARRTHDISILKNLASDHNGWVRYEVAANPHTPQEVRVNMVRLDTDWLLYPALVSNKEALMTQEEWEEIDNIYNSHLNK